MEKNGGFTGQGKFKEYVENLPGQKEKKKKRKLSFKEECQVIKTRGIMKTDYHSSNTIDADLINNECESC